MSYKYQSALVEAVGSSFYYFNNQQKFDLTKPNSFSFKDFTDGWVDLYQGKQHNFNNVYIPQYNIFRPCVDQLVHRILTVTEDEIERRVNEKVNEILNKQQLGSKNV